MSHSTCVNNFVFTGKYMPTDHITLRTYIRVLEIMIYHKTAVQYFNILQVVFLIPAQGWLIRMGMLVKNFNIFCFSLKVHPSFKAIWKF